MADPDSAVRQQFAQWMEAWGDRIVRFAYVYVGDSGAAQDVAQETFLRLYEQMRAGAAIQPAWLFRVARNVAVDGMRRQQRRQNARGQLSRERAPSTNQANNPIDRLVVRQVIDTLPEADRTCLLLYYFADWSLEEIGRSLSLNPGAVKARLHRARARFAQAWKEDDDERVR